MIFKDRVDAGHQLARALSSYAGLPNHLVVGLPRGGVVVARQVALALKLPLEIIVARKIGSPFNPEFAIGALAGDEIYLDRDVIARIGATKEQIDQRIREEKKEALRRERIYRVNRKPLSFLNQTILLIDDGIATGSTLRVSIAYLKQMKVSGIVVAVPVAPAEIIDSLKQEVDAVICLSSPFDFFSVGQFYLDFTPVTDEAVCNALKFL